MKETMDERFWEKKSLQEMTREEWEAICDGCARCCLHKLHDEENDEVFYTNVACRELDLGSCQCKNYAERSSRVAHCQELSPDRDDVFAWLPETCSYRSLREGLGLPWWHPLVSGTRESLEEAGISIQGMIISENEIRLEDLEDYIVEWIEPIDLSGDLLLK